MVTGVNAEMRKSFVGMGKLSVLYIIVLQYTQHQLFLLILVESGCVIYASYGYIHLISCLF